MLSAEDLTKIRTKFPLFANTQSELVKEVSTAGQLLSFSPGQIIFSEGDSCSALALVVEGEVRVYKQGESGREITLYRLGPGESCILTASCILNEESFPALAVVEKPSLALVVPAVSLRAWMERFPAWREFVFRLITRRLGNVISVVEEVAFRRMDERLAEYLQKRLTRTGSELHITHQEIADELGTAREVVSRLLKDFEEEDIVMVERGLIRLKNRELLLSMFGD